jgi:hypothetical protein
MAETQEQAAARIARCAGENSASDASAIVLLPSPPASVTVTRRSGNGGATRRRGSLEEDHRRRDPERKIAEQLHDEARQLLLIRGAVPGAKNGFVTVRIAVKGQPKVAAPAAKAAAPAKGSK